MCEHVYIYIYTFIHICMYICIHTYIYIYSSTNKDVSNEARLINICESLLEEVYVSIYVPKHIYINISTYIYIGNIIGLEKVDTNYEYRWRLRILFHIFHCPVETYDHALMFMRANICSCVQSLLFSQIHSWIHESRVFVYDCVYVCVYVCKFACVCMSLCVGMPSSKKQSSVCAPLHGKTKQNMYTNSSVICLTSRATICHSVLQRVAVCCSVLQCVMMGQCCSVMQCVTMGKCLTYRARIANLITDWYEWQCVAVCCRV